MNFKDNLIHMLSNIHQMIKIFFFKFDSSEIIFDLRLEVETYLNTTTRWFLSC